MSFIPRAHLPIAYTLHPRASNEIKRYPVAQAGRLDRVQGLWGIRKAPAS